MSTRGIVVMMERAFSVTRLADGEDWRSFDAQHAGLVAHLRDLHPGIPDPVASENALFGMATANWMANGFPRVTMGHKHAALLMCTHVPIELVDVVPMPWHAFVVDVPKGLGIEPERPADEPPGSVDHILLWRSGAADVSCVMINGDVGCVEGMFDVKRALGGEMPRIGRMAKTVARYVLGACVDMDRHRSVGASAGRRLQVRRNARGEPETNTFTLRRDVKVDCRAAVRGYVAGATRGDVTVRSLIRGHWKYQPCGAGRTDRKFIHVEPYWRGPDDAPIAVRSHVLGADL